MPGWGPPTRHSRPRSGRRCYLPRPFRHCPRQGAGSRCCHWRYCLRRWRYCWGHSAGRRQAPGPAWRLQSFVSFPTNALIWIRFDQVPAIAVEIAEYSDLAVGLVARRFLESDPKIEHSAMGPFEILHLKEKADPAAMLIADA